MYFQYIIQPNWKYDTFSRMTTAFMEKNEIGDILPLHAIVFVWLEQDTITAFWNDVVSWIFSFRYGEGVDIFQLLYSSIGILFGKRLWSNGHMIISQYVP